MTLPINHLIRTLDRCCGDYEILAHTDSTREPFEATVEHLQTGNVYRCSKRKDHNWTASDAHSEFLINRLNGLTRDDSGTMRTDAGVQLPADFDCVPEASDEQLKKGDWVVCVNARGCDLVYGCKYEVTSTYSDGGDFLVLKGFTANYHASRFRRARPDEIPQPVNINACDNPSGPCACGAWHNESDKPCDGDSFTPGKPVEQAQPLQLREGAWYRREAGGTVGPMIRRVKPNRGDFLYPFCCGSSFFTESGIPSSDIESPLVAEVPAPSEPTAEPALAKMLDCDVSQLPSEQVKRKRSQSCEIGRASCRERVSSPV